MSTRTYTPEPLDIGSRWISIHKELPHPEDALVIKQAKGTNEAADDWIGMVMGLYMGTEVPLIVFACGDDVQISPMVEGGMSVSSLVTHWCPWPKEGMKARWAPTGPLPSSELPASTCRRCRKLNSRTSGCAEC